MHSKTYLHHPRSVHSKVQYLAGLALAALLTQSCAWIQDRPKPAPALQSEAMNLKCMDDLPRRLQKLSEGDYTASSSDQQELKGLWSCLDKAVYSFAEYTHGRSGENYSQAEMQEFANRFLPNNKKLSSSFADAIYRLKSSMLGGTTTYLTKQEIHELRQKLNRFGELTLPISPWVKVLLAPQKYAAQERKLAADQIKAFLNDLTNIFSEGQHATSWKDFSDFVSELDTFLAEDTQGFSARLFTFGTTSKKVSALAFIKEQLPIFQYVKLLIVGGSETEIELAKWKPIFKGISNLYQAFLLSNNSTELLENLNFALESTTDDQQKATTQISSLLKSMVAEGDRLASFEMVKTLASGWAMAMVANNMVFPKLKGAIAVQTFTHSLPLRKLAGTALDLFLKIDWNHPKPEQVKELSYQLQAMLDPNILGVGANDINSFKISDIEATIAQLEPLFASKTNFQLFKQGVKLLPLGRSLLLGKTNEEIQVSDLKEMLSKMTEVYLQWAVPFKNQEDWIEAVGASLDILLKSPTANWIRQDEVLAVIDQAQTVVQSAEIQIDLPWKNFKILTKSAFEMKALAFGTAPQSLSLYEIKTLKSVWDALRVPGDYSTRLESLGDRLKASPFRDLSISAVYEQAKPVLEILGMTLPSEIDAQGIGLLKGLAWGGSTGQFEKTDHANYAYAAASAYRELYPLIKDGLTLTFNSKMTSLLKATLNWAMHLKRTEPETPWSTLKSFTLWASGKMGYTLRDQSAEDLLIALQHRLLGAQKTPKPKTLVGSFKPEVLKPVYDLLSTLNEQLIDLDRAYQGISIATTPVAKEKIEALVTLPEVKRIVELYPPQINALTGALEFPKLGQTLNDYYYLDIAYKLFCKQAVEWVFRNYHLNEDPFGEIQPKGLYLNVTDATDLLESINGFLMDFEVSFSQKSPADIALERFTTINTFTQTGNGNPFVEVDETVEFLSMTLGGQVLMTNIRKGLAEACAPGVPYREVKAFPGHCLIKTYFQLPFMKKIYEPIMPQLTQQLESFDEAQLEDFKKSTLFTIDPKIGENDTFYLNHIEIIASLPQYIENLVTKMDLNHNSVLEFSELYREFPRFCLEIKRAGKGMLKGSCNPGYSGGQIEAVFGYIILNGEPPDAPQPTDRPRVWLKKAAFMLKWFATWRKMNKSPEYRDPISMKLTRKDIVKIFANLAAANLQ